MSGFPDVLRLADLRRIRRWAAVFIEFTATQAAIQALGMVTGILVVRLLSAQQYALFTISNAMVSSIYILAEAGIGGALAGIGGRTYHDPLRFGQSVGTALQITTWLRNVVCLPIIGMLTWLLMRNGAAPLETAALAVLVLAGGALSLQNEIRTVVPRILGATRLQQWVSTIGPVLRLALTLLLSLAGLVAGTAVLAVVAGYALQYLLLRRWVAARVTVSTEAEPTVRANMVAAVRRQMPNALYFLARGQINIWLLSVFGTSGTVADLGAITRISIVFSILLATMQGVVVPRFSRCQDPAQLGPLFSQIILGLLAMAWIPVAIVWVAPEPILWVLGPTYAHLSTELLLAVVAVSINAVGTLAWMLSANKGWFLPAWINIPMGIVAQIVLISAIGASTVRQVLLMSIVFEAIYVAVNLGAGMVFIRRFRRRAASASASGNPIPISGSHE